MLIGLVYLLSVCILSVCKSQGMESNKVGQANIGIIFSFIGNSQCLYNTKTTLIDWFILEINDNATLNTNMPY